jgi:hypothetical protein
MGATGTATIDFGAAPGSNEASVAVTGQAAIGAGSDVEPYFRGDDTTTDHNADDHKYAALLISVTAADLVAGTGFTIHARSTEEMEGTFKIRWVWN